MNQMRKNRVVSDLHVCPLYAPRASDPNRQVGDLSYVQLLKQVPENDVAGYTP